MKSLPYVLRFLAGSTPGVEVPLKAFAKQVLIGRSDEADLLLDDSHASRKHARLFIDNNQLFVEDLGSKNGVFVNARKIQSATPLKEGDRVQCGSSLLKLTRPKAMDPNRDAPTAHLSKEPEAQANPAPSFREPNRFSGAIDEIPMPDLLQVLSTAKKSGVLQIQGLQGQGAFLLRDGQIRYAWIGRPPKVVGAKAVYRMVAWRLGEFVFRPGEDQKFENEIEEPTDFLLMEAMRQMDELAAMQSSLPARTVALTITPSCPSPEALSGDSAIIMGMLRQSPKMLVVALVDTCPLPDVEAYQAILSMMKAGHLKTELNW